MKTSKQHVHILGICGTFMAGLAVLARQLGHRVTGSDEKVYPPMSTQLEEQGITLLEGFEPSHLDPRPDVVIIGNAMKRGNPAVEAVLNLGLPYVSGPQWLAETVLNSRWVLAVAGTHGKTTTSSLLTWILEYAGLKPGFLIGGIPKNFGVSARLGDSPFFVVEADEYDSAFFDKRSKFIHYRPRTAILNNLEYDHADIFSDLAAIEQQFHHFIRTIPSEGLIIKQAQDENLSRVIAQGCWTPIQSFSAIGDADWSVTDMNQDGSEFTVLFKSKEKGKVQWPIFGRHNVSNALAAIAAAVHVGVLPALACEALTQFQMVKRRLEVLGEVRGITVYDDFAHHPTAIAETLNALRQRVGESQRILAVLDFASYTMRHGSHRDQIAPSLKMADRIYLKRPADSEWDLNDLKQQTQCSEAYEETHDIIRDLVLDAQPGDHILVMSNRGFDGIHQKLLQALKEKV